MRGLGVERYVLYLLFIVIVVVLSGGKNFNHLFLIKLVRAQIVLELKNVRWGGLQVYDNVLLCKYINVHIVLLAYMAQLTEGIGIGIAHLTTQVVAHTVEDARQLALQLDVTTKTRYWPWVVLQLTEIGYRPLHLHRNEWEVILVAVLELNELLVCIKLIMSKLHHLLALVNEHFGFILGCDDEVEELQRITLVKP